MAGVGSQSVAVADPVLSGAELAVHSMVIFAGQDMTGARLSSITIVWMQAVELPQASVAVQVLVIVNSCGQLPLAVASLKVTRGAPSQLSVAVADPVAAGKVFVPHSMVTFEGHVIAGA